MRTFAHLALLCLLALTMTAPAVAGAARATISATGTPDGFAELATARPTLVDLYFGNRKVGEALADTQPGLLKFRSPSDVLAKLPQVIVTPDLTSRLSGELPTNSASVCSPGGPSECGSLAPDVLAIIYDEDRFRVDLFVNPRFLRTVRAESGGYLPAPTAAASLTSAFGVAAAGSVGGRTTYNLQNRTIVAFENARIRTSNSLASGLGWVVDDLAAEVDRKDVRYSAGLFWAPGSDFTGQRRMIGAGFGTQFDTQRDPAAIQGTPLVLFLSQPARVEVLVDGRLVTSGTYAAGNDELDTSALPQGSYDVELRIHEQSGAVRSEHRFFVKTPSVPPVGHPVYFGYAGVLANTRANHPIDPGSTLFYQAGAAWRLGNSAAFDVQAIGTQRKAMVQAGGWLIERPARVRVAALASTKGDAGLLVQVGSGALGDLNFNFDLRRIWSGDGEPLIPLPDAVQSFDSDEPIGLQRAEGSYTQAVGSVGLRIGSGNLSVIGSYRKDRRHDADYSIGPSLNWPLVTRNGLQLVLELSGQRTRTGTAAFAGIRILSTSGPVSVASTLGQSIEDRAGEAGGATGRSTGSVAVQYSRETAGGALLTGEVGADRDISASAVHAGATLSSDVGNARVDVLHGLEGRAGTQFDLNVQSGLAISGRSATIGARQTEPSAIIVSVHGDARDALFQVLVDDLPRGQVRSGQRLSLFVPAYRSYRVRLLPVDAASVDYDAGARDVTLYPGNVEVLDWTAQSYFTLVAQAVLPDGSPIRDALVQTQKAVAQTDSSGYFQIDLRSGDAITIAREGAGACSVELPRLMVKNDFASAGKVICK